MQPLSSRPDARVDGRSARRGVPHPPPPPRRRRGSARRAEWYGTRGPALGDDEESVAASVVWLLKGDAGQRAIVAQAMGWRAAQEASGARWLAPYLALTQKDQYDAVRLIASRAAKTLPPFSRDQLPRGSTELLITADGTFDAARVNRLVRERNNRPLVYRE